MPPALEGALRAQASSPTRGGDSRGLGDEAEQSPTLTAGGHEPAVYSMSAGRMAHASVGREVCGALTAHDGREPPVVCGGGCVTQYGEELAGTLRARAGSPTPDSGANVVTAGRGPCGRT